MLCKFLKFNNLVKSPFRAASNVKNLLENAANFDNIAPNTEEQVWATLPYPEGTPTNRLQSLKVKRPKTDPRETSIILFPGEGNHFVGMAKHLLKYPMAKDLFELANYTLNYNLLKICNNGPPTELDKLEYSHLATLVTSLATLEKLKEERPRAIDNCFATAGFGLGEITALVFSGALHFEDALKLVQIRAEAMKMICDNTKSTMAQVLFGPDSKLGQACVEAKEWCLNKGIENPNCSVAFYMYPHCKVVAGNEEAITFLEQNSERFKLKSIKRLSQYHGAFYSQLMEPVMEPLRNALRQIKIFDPIISVLSNIDGKPYKNSLHIKKQLPKQIVKPIKWEQVLHVLYERPQGEYFPKTYICGPNNILLQTIKEVNVKAASVTFKIVG